MKRFVVVAMAMAVISGCVAAPPSVPSTSSPSSPANSSPPVRREPTVRVWHGDLSRVNTVEGPANEWGRQSARLFATFKEGQLPAYTILFISTYDGEWRFYQAAVDEHGTEHSVLPRNRQVIGCPGRGAGCTLQEAVDIVFSRAQLDAARTSELRFKVSGQGETEIVTYPGAAIEAVLARVDQLMAARSPG